MGGIVFSMWQTHYLYRTAYGNLGVTWACYSACRSSHPSTGFPNLPDTDTALADTSRFTGDTISIGVYVFEARDFRGDVHRPSEM